MFNLPSPHCSYPPCTADIVLPAAGARDWLEAVTTTAVLSGEIDDSPGGEEGARPGAAGGHQGQAGVQEDVASGGGQTDTDRHQYSAAQISRDHADNQG